MRFTTVLALLAAPLLAFAQNPNPFNIPPEGLAAQAGDTLDLSWEPTTQGTVTLVLRSGSSNNLDEGTVIASSIPNSGSYSWQVPEGITRGSDYAIEIVDDSDPTATNYTPYFVIDSNNTVASTTPTVTLGASSTSLSTQTGVETSTTQSNGSETTATAASTETTGSDMSMTSGSSMTTGGASSSSPGASFQPTGNSAASSSTPNSAPRATAMAGMLGVVALGALAL